MTGRAQRFFKICCLCCPVGEIRAFPAAEPLHGGYIVVGTVLPLEKGAAISHGRQAVLEVPVRVVLRVLPPVNVASPSIAGEPIAPCPLSQLFDLLDSDYFLNK